MISWMEENLKVGAVSCMLKNKDGSIQETGGYFPTLPRVFSWMIIQDIPFIDNLVKPFHPKTAYYKNQHELDWLTGAFILTRKKITEKIHWEEKYFMYTEDVDFCFKIKKHGYKLVYIPNWSIIHLGGSSGTREKTIISEFEGVKMFYKKHRPKWQYPFLRLILKAGCLPRILISPKIYAKAFIQI
jgi:GT2 family glycosyltransferase